MIISVIVIMTIITLMMTVMMIMMTSLIYCLTVSSVFFWPDVDYITISAASNTLVLAPICSKSYSIE